LHQQVICQSRVIVVHIYSFIY